MKQPLLARLFALLLYIATTDTRAADLQELPLTDLKPFRSQAGNWRIVENVSIDPRLDPKESSEAVRSQAGSGVLLNLNTKEQEDHLITKLEHGDIELELELMLPRHSNSGLYLQGRYEIQLLDSWGVLHPRYGDMGGIYRNWKLEPDEQFHGVAPRTNASKAPGLWQTLHLVFRAPRFDEQGRKTANARFDFVDLNGYRIHENVEVPTLTGGALAEQEAAVGPLMIQGDHGPIAFRNIRYALLESPQVELKSLSYTAHTGAFESASALDSAEPVAKGSAQGINAYASGSDDKFGLRFTGELVIGEADEYSFELSHTGAVLLKLNGETLFDRQLPAAQGKQSAAATLKAGKHPIELYYFKDIAWSPPRLALTVKGSRTHEVALHTPESFPVKQDVVSPIYVDVGRTTRLHRGFFDANGKRYSHTLAVGDPSGVHYVIDLESAQILAAWRGDFIDATPMWHDRGNGTYTARGVAASLAEASPFTGSKQENLPRLLGYELTGDLKRPIFRYMYQSNEYTLKLEPDVDGKKLLCEIALGEDAAAPSLEVSLAKDADIEALPGGLFAIGDRQYFVEVLTSEASSQNRQRKLGALRIPFHGACFAYALIW